MFKTITVFAFSLLLAGQAFALSFELPEIDASKLPGRLLYSDFRKTSETNTYFVTVVALESGLFEKGRLDLACDKTEPTQVVCIATDYQKTQQFAYCASNGKCTNQVTSKYVKVELIDYYSGQPLTGSFVVPVVTNVETGESFYISGEGIRLPIPAQYRFSGTDQGSFCHVASKTVDLQISSPTTINLEVGCE